MADLRVQAEQDRGREAGEAIASALPPRALAPWIWLLLAWLALAGAIGRELLLAHEAIWAHEREHLKHQAEIVDTRLGAKLQSIGNALGWIRHELILSPALASGKAEESLHLKSLVEVMRGVGTLLVVDADGTVWASSRPEIVGRSFRLSEADRTISSSHDPEILYIVPSPLPVPGGTSAVGVGKALFDRDGGFGGFALAIVDPDELGALLHSVLYVTDMRAGLAYGDGRIIPPVSGEGDESPEGPFAEAGESLLQHVKSGMRESGPVLVAVSPADERMVAYRTVRPERDRADRPLVVFLSRDVSAMFAPWRTRLLASAVFLGVTGLAAVAALLLYQRRKRADAWLRLDAEAQRRAAGERLRESEARWKFALEGGGQGVWDWDMVRGRMYLSPRYAQMLGYEDGELGHSPEARIEAVHPDDRARVSAVCDEGCGREAPYCLSEFRARRKDGSYIWIESRGMIVDRTPDGRPARMIGTHTEITERKSLERAAQERGALMEALLKQQVASQTAAAFAHELNQPLVAISAYSEAALNMVRSGQADSGKIVHAIEGSFNQSQRAGEVLRELIARLNRRQGGEAETAPFDINDLVAEAVDAVRQWLLPELQASLDLDAGVPPALGNRLQTEKVIVNLLANGIEAMQAAGVAASSIRIAVSVQASDGLAHVRIRDFGPGLDAEAARRIFEPLFSTKRNGMGLGLAISRSLIEAQNGRLWVDIACAPGAEFHFTLPLAHG